MSANLEKAIQDEDTGVDPLVGVPGSAAMSRIGILALTMYIIVCAVALIAALIVLWPGSEDFLPSTIKLPPAEVKMLLLSMTAGALGGVLQALASVGWYAGNRALVSSWSLMYIIKPFIGAILGMFVYISIRGGILKVGSNIDALNPYTVIPIIAFTGLFSQHILLRLKDFAESKLARPVPGADARPLSGSPVRKRSRRSV